MRQFERLLKVVRERGGDGPRLDRPWCLPLADWVLYYRTNLTIRQLAPLFGISPATVCRVIQRLHPLLAGEEADNAEHRKVRARVEHTFARMKN